MSSESLLPISNAAAAEKSEADDAQATQTKERPCCRLGYNIDINRCRKGCQIVVITRAIRRKGRLQSVNAQEGIRTDRQSQGGDVMSSADVVHARVRFG